jgi:proteasome lid subunit RPN8/RPN11
MNPFNITDKSAFKATKRLKKAIGEPGSFEEYDAYDKRCSYYMDQKDYDADYDTDYDAEQEVLPQHTLLIPEFVRLKLATWRDLGNTEVTGFFISDPANPLKIIDAVLVKADCTCVTVDISSDSLMDLYAKMAQEQQVYTDQLRIWWHTHPNMAPIPSGTDRETFESINQSRGLGIMYICGQTEDYAEMQITDIPTGLTLTRSLEIRPYSSKFSDVNYEELMDEYFACVKDVSVNHLFDWKKQKGKAENLKDSFGEKEIAV